MHIRHIYRPFLQFITIYHEKRLDEKLVNYIPLVWRRVVIEVQHFTARELNKRIFHKPQKLRTVYLPYQQTYSKVDAH